MTPRCRGGHNIILVVMNGRLGGGVFRAVGLADIFDLQINYVFKTSSLYRDTTSPARNICPENWHVRVKAAGSKRQIASFFFLLQTLFFDEFDGSLVCFERLERKQKIWHVNCRPAVGPTTKTRLCQSLNVI